MDLWLYLIGCILMVYEDSSNVYLFLFFGTILPLFLYVLQINFLVSTSSSLIIHLDEELLNRRCFIVSSRSLWGLVLWLCATKVL